MAAQEIEEHKFGIWKTVAWRSHKLRTEILPPNAFLDIFLFVSNKLAFCAWNFTDLLIIILCRALYFKFRILQQVADKFVGKELLQPVFRTRKGK
jgi:hypothetical protein